MGRGQGEKPATRGEEAPSDARRRGHRCVRRGGGPGGRRADRRRHRAERSAAEPRQDEHTPNAQGGSGSAALKLAPLPPGLRRSPRACAAASGLASPPPGLRRFLSLRRRLRACAPRRPTADGAREAAPRVRSESPDRSRANMTRKQKRNLDWKKHRQAKKHCKVALPLG